jgi:hypothetical protein
MWWLRAPVCCRLLNLGLRIDLRANKLVPSGGCSRYIVFLELVPMSLARFCPHMDDNASSFRNSIICNKKCLHCRYVDFMILYVFLISLLSY